VQKSVTLSSSVTGYGADSEVHAELLFVRENHHPIIVNLDDVR